MRWTGPFLIALALLSLGCAQHDWTTETLTLVDVTGTWEGPFRFGGASSSAGAERTIRWVLQQKGAKVRGEVQGLDGAPLGSVEGLINGEAFNWQVTATKLIWSNAPPRSYYRGVVTANSDVSTTAHVSDLDPPQFSTASRSRSASASSGVTHRPNTTPHGHATVSR